MFEPIADEVEQIAKHIVDAAFQVHRQLGPGLLESVYETCLCHELAKRNLRLRDRSHCPLSMTVFD